MAAVTTRAFAAALAVAMSAPSARAEDRTHACVTAASKAQELRDAGKLTHARAQLLECSRQDCPRVVVSDCTQWLADVNARLPTVVLAARDAEGRDLLHVRVSVDGAHVTDSLDGRAIEIDPGPHTFRFDSDGRVGATRDVILREGERMRPITVVLESAAKPAAPVEAPPAPRSRWTAPVIVAGAVSAVALGGFAYFGITGQSDKNDLANGCAVTRTCLASDVDATRTKLVVADVLLGTAVVALGVAAVLFVTGSDRERATLR